MNQHEQCADCWATFHTSHMEYDMDSDEWLCNDCFEERAIKELERDHDEP
jgi:hypothetical protein